MLRSPSLFVALVALQWAPALAFDPRLPVVGGEPSPAEKLARFQAQNQDDPQVQAALTGAHVAEVPERERIHLALLATQPAYADAYAEFERSGTNVAHWRKLLEGLPKEATFLRAHATYFLGRSALQLEDSKAAAAAFEAVRGRLRLHCPWTDEATLFLAQVYACLPGSSSRVEAANQARARRLLAGLLDPAEARFGWAPERVHEGAAWLERELRGEGSGPLLALARKMAVIQRLIRDTETGQPTQERQEEVVTQLDRLIEMLREKEGGG